MLGFICGVSFTLFLLFGALVIPKPDVTLPTSTDHCPAHVINETLSRLTSWPNSTYVQEYEPQ